MVIIVFWNNYSAKGLTVNTFLYPVKSSKIKDRGRRPPVYYPIWWYDMPAVMYTFFDQYDFSGKTIIPFTTHGGSRLSGTVETIAELEPEAQVSDQALTISRNDVEGAASEVADWVASLNLGN